MAWRTLHEAIPTNDSLHERGAIIDTSCKRCEAHEEPKLHIFCNCGSVDAVWFGSSLGLYL